MEMRHFWSALLAALLTARAALAQVAAVPASAGVTPMAQYAALRRGDIPAALAFLHTPVLQEWLWVSRPTQAEGVLGLAHRLADFSKVMRTYRWDPTFMRSAMLTRNGESMLQNETQMTAVLDSNRFLVAPWAKEALCSWSYLQGNMYVRQALSARGHTEDTWRNYELPRRIEIMREIWFEWLQARRPQSVLDPFYPKILHEFLDHAFGYLSSEERWSIRCDAERAERLAMRVSEARVRIESSGDQAALRGLASVASQNDVNREGRIFDPIFAGAAGNEVSTKMSPAASDGVLRELAARLPAANPRLGRGNARCGGAR